MSLTTDLLRSAGARSLHRLHRLQHGDSATRVQAQLGPPDSVLPGDEPGQQQWQHTLYDRQRGWVPCLLVLAGANGPLLHWGVDAQRQRQFDDLLAGLDDRSRDAPFPSTTTGSTT